jgi:DNA mismatch repair protein MutS2
MQYDALLADLERRTRALEAQERVLAERRAGWDRERRESQEKAYREAREVVSAVKREVNAVLEEAKRERSRASMKKLVAVEEQVEEKIREFDGETHLTMEQIREGDTVFVRTIGFDAVVVKADPKAKRVRLLAAGKELEVALSDIGVRKGKARQPGKATRTKAAEPEETMFQLHLIGLRVDDALTRLEPFLNHASLDAVGEVRIVHGKGTGALKRAIREYLGGHPLVESFRDGEPFEGGSGVTVVRIK